MARYVSLCILYERIHNLVRTISLPEIVCERVLIRFDALTLLALVFCGSTMQNWEHVRVSLHD